MIKSGLIFKGACSVIILFLIIGGLLFSASNNLNYTGLWYDETASFWISQGLHNYSDINQPRKGILQVIRNNRFSNLDPGGHSVLLHFWTTFRQDILWLRLLSFIFFLLTVISMGLLAWQWTGGFVFPLFSMLIPFAFGPILYYAFEIRAYSMETAGIIFGSFCLARFFNQPNFSNLLILGISCGLFMGSRYTYIVFVLAAFCSYLFFVFAKPDNERKRLLSISYAFLVPVIVSGMLICYVSLGYHLNHGMSLEYMSEWMAEGKGIHELLHLFRLNFISLPAFPITAALLAFFVVHPFMCRHFPHSYAKTFHKNFGPDTAPFYWLILMTQILFFLFSMAGYTPWDISKKWGLHLVAISMIAALLLMTECYRFFEVLYERRDLRLAKQMEALTAFCVLALAGLLAFHAATYRHTYYVNLAPAVEYLNSLALPKHSVFVAGYEIPVVRYLYEFGPYKDSDKYPRIFRFQKTSEWDKSVPINADTEGLLYFITAESPEDFNRRLLKREARKVIGVPHLLITELSK